MAVNQKAKYQYVVSMASGVSNGMAASAGGSRK
jgi:hypothetical protein